MRTRANDLVCRAAIELMSDYIEGSLSRRDRRRLERHLAGCPDCSRYLEQMRLTIDASGSVSPDELAPEALDDLVEIFRAFRREDGD